VRELLIVTRLLHFSKFFYPNFRWTPDWKVHQVNSRVVYPRLPTPFTFFAAVKFVEGDFTDEANYSWLAGQNDFSRPPDPCLLLAVL
jgi:hypothetical protein